MSWRDNAECKGVNPDLFFPERGESTRPPKDWCKKCTVRQQCLDYAIENNERFGIWGGLSERERRAYRKHANNVTFSSRNRGEATRDLRELLEALKKRAS